MKIYEYQGKELCRRYGIPIPPGQVINEKREIAGIFRQISQGTGVILKAQLLGRPVGTPANTLTAMTAKEGENLYDDLINMTIFGQTVRKVLMEEKLNGNQEYRFSLTVDSAKVIPILLFSDTKAADPGSSKALNADKTVTIPIDIAYGLLDHQLRAELIEFGLMGSEVKAALCIARKLYRIFIERDALAIEACLSTPADSDRFVVSDLYMEFDDAAIYRQPEIQEMETDREKNIEETLSHEYKLEYVEMTGNVGVISGGAGLTMATVDCIAMAGGKPACFLDCTANASPAGYEVALRTLNTRKDIDCIMVNIYGGATRSDLVGKYIMQAMDRIGSLSKPLVVRLDGTDAETGRMFLKDKNLYLCDTMEEAIRLAVDLGEGRK